MIRTVLSTALLGCFLLMQTAQARAPWKPAEGPLMTPWGEKVTPENVHAEYPRPQLVREKWTNLNGLWDYAIRSKDAALPARFDGEILVPFPIESALSGVKKTVGDANRLWYRRSFSAAKPAGGGRLLLHFGAVDWDATVLVNGTQVGRHKGGYEAFTCDVTDALMDGPEQKLVVNVWDPTDRSFQPRGKQVSVPKGIWYTSVTGIWQTVWLEEVPAASIASLKMIPDVDAGVLRLTVTGRGTKAGDTVEAAALDTGKQAGSATGKVGEEIEIAIPDAKLWSPDSPFLYDLQVTLLRGPSAADTVTGYFGMRKIAIGKDEAGFNRLMLNNRPLFQLGPLDQGWWPDGLYTAASDEALRYDVEVTRKLGFNMARKHVKIEPDRWYYHCDKLGLMVWQDMPSGDGHIGGNAPDLERSPESAANFRREYKALIDGYGNHPCIVAWVPFNEGWGQFDTNEIMAWTKKYDPTRLVDGPSGWTDRGTGDMHDVHRYPGPAMPEPEEGRAVVLGEFGGLGLPIEGHLWWNKHNWGYRTYKTLGELRSHYAQLIRRLHPMIGKGLAAAVYTQTSDVEGEVNGLMTYDRKIIKLDVDTVAKLHAKLFLPPPVIIRKAIVPDSRKEAQSWRYTTSAPQQGWRNIEFDDSAFKSAPGGFGRAGTPGGVIRTEWHEPDIWLRRTFELSDTRLTAPHLTIHHDEDVEVYINGQLVFQAEGYTAEYIDVPLGAEAQKTLKTGTNTIAVHCRQTTGGQYIDVGLTEVIEKPADRKEKRVHVGF